MSESKSFSRPIELMIFNRDTRISSSNIYRAKMMKRQDWRFFVVDSWAVNVWLYRGYIELGGKTANAR